MFFALSLTLSPSFSDGRGGSHPRRRGQSLLRKVSPADSRTLQDMAVVGRDARRGAQPRGVLHVHAFGGAATERDRDSRHAPLLAAALPTHSRGGERRRRPHRLPHHQPLLHRAPTRRLGPSPTAAAPNAAAATALGRRRSRRGYRQRLDRRPFSAATTTAAATTTMGSFFRVADVEYFI